MNRKITTGLMTILLVSAAMAGCAGEEESNLDPSDGGGFKGIYVQIGRASCRERV